MTIEEKHATKRQPSQLIVGLLQHQPKVLGGVDRGYRNCDSHRTTPCFACLRGRFFPIYCSFLGLLLGTNQGVFSSGLALQNSIREE